MRFIREFSYPDVFQRRIILYHSFCLLMSGVYVLASVAAAYYRYAPYEPLFHSVILFGLAGFFAGTLAGKALFKYLKQYRPVLVLGGILCGAAFILYLSREYLFNLGLNGYRILFVGSGAYLKAFLMGSGFFSGIIMNYVLKILCGDFIDEKRGIIIFFTSSILAVAAALAFCVGACFFNWINYLMLVPAAVLPVTSFLIKLPYNPSPIFAQETNDLREGEGLTRQARAKRDDLFFIYLNFTYILIYAYFGYLSVVRCYGSSAGLQLYFVAISLAGVLAGFSLAGLRRAPFWHIYTEMLYPVFFMLFMVLLYIFGDRLEAHYGPLLFMPVAVIFGFSIYHTLNNILGHYNHGGRFTIIFFSLFVLPFPILVVLQHVDFSNLWFFILTYALLLMNIIFPGIHLLQHSERNYQKALFFVFSLVFVPLVIFNHVYFKIPLNSDLYARLTRGSNGLHSENLNAGFIKKGGVVYYNDSEIFIATNSTVKNLHRSIAMAGVFCFNVPAAKGPVIFINGYSRFLWTPLAFPLENTRVLDYIPDRALDFRRPAISGRKSYGKESRSIVPYLVNAGEKFSALVDAPNLYDQTNWPFRFSEEFYSLVAGALSPGGLFIQIININHCRRSFLASAGVNLGKKFRKTAVFLFSDHMVLIGSTTDDGLYIDDQTIAGMKKLFEDDQDISALFYNEYQPLTHMLYADTAELFPAGAPNERTTASLFKNPVMFSLSDRQADDYLTNNLRALDIVKVSPARPDFKYVLHQALHGGSEVYSLLKAAYYYESRRDFELESQKLFQLKKYTEYHYELREYINNILAYKNEFYYLEALRLENDKQWEEAGRLYRAILKINPDHFEANYRLGILSIILQDLDAAFTYLQQAMRMKGNDPKVLYQMGVLLFSSERTAEALQYFNRAIELNENTASIHNYVGLCHEKLGNLNEAKNSYNRAMLLDANDVAIKSNLERISQAMEDEKSKWKLPDQKNQSDVEQGENIPLPINKSARDIRLKDDE